MFILLYFFFFFFFFFYLLFLVPFRIGFMGNIASTPTESVLDPIVTAIFSIDIIVTCNTAYYSKKEQNMIVDRRRIFKNYAMLWLWIDLISTIPFSSIVEASSTDSVKLVKLLRLFRLAKLYRMVQSTQLRGTYVLTYD